MRYIKQYAAFLLTVSMVFRALPAAAGAGPTFADVPTTHWAYTSIEQAAADGIVEGIGNIMEPMCNIPSQSLPFQRIAFPC